MIDLRRTERLITVFFRLDFDAPYGGGSLSAEKSLFRNTCAQCFMPIPGFIQEKRMGGKMGSVAAVYRAAADSR